MCIRDLCTFFGKITGLYLFVRSWKEICIACFKDGATTVSVRMLVCVVLMVVVEICLHRVYSFVAVDVYIVFFIHFIPRREAISWERIAALSRVILPDSDVSSSYSSIRCSARARSLLSVWWFTFFQVCVSSPIVHDHHTLLSGEWMFIVFPLISVRMSRISYSLKDMAPALAKLFHSHGLGRLPEWNAMGYLIWRYKVEWGALQGL